jgi:hypothetical protein
MAGVYAAHRYQGARRPNWKDKTAAGDLENTFSLTAMAAKLGGGSDLPAWGAFTLTPAERAEQEKIVARLTAEIEKLIQENWSAIERVAQALVQQRALTGAEIDALIADARPVVTPPKHRAE